MEPEELYRPFVIDELEEAGQDRAVLEDSTDNELEEEYEALTGRKCIIIDDVDTD